MKCYEYSTHLPVLKRIGKSIPVKNVLEFGSGMHSTGLFLDKKYFPDLLSLNSMENEFNWYKIVKKKFGIDRRLNLYFVKDVFPSMPEQIEQDRYSVMFVDGFDRRRIMNEKSELSDVLILHDGPDDNKPHRYLGSIKKFKYSFIYVPRPKKYKNKYLPTTVVMSNVLDVVSILTNI